ncbi:hypothetical protein J2W22_002561 [Sphingomonas kyeonggiensis]|uniref:hypothetical protein n=1 Tax=Sphingomonas kyeonggiensis TaxID=1268553 RepID=UPI002782DE5B|nr:hypothetical protein [Sphingomonas kyeonggiensis]MDQ0250497.1 hypothetical protein [Sphingomonas kyeonggiensis]
MAMRSGAAFLAGTIVGAGLGFAGKRREASEPEWSHREDEFLYNPTVLLLEANLRASARMMDLMRDDDFAQQLADMLASSIGNFCTLGGEILLRCSSDSARAVVAHLRGRGEDYLSFVHSIAPRPLRTEPAQVLAELEAIGWRRPSDEELAALKAVEALSERNSRIALQRDRAEA